MAQKVTCVFKQPDSTELLNYHVAKLLAKGPYRGMMIEAQTPNSMFVDMTAGYAFTIEGVKIEETDPVTAVVEIPAADTTFDRKDLIVLTHQYVAGATVPAGNYATYRVITGTLPADTLTVPEVPYDQMTEFEVPLCEVWLPHGATFVSEDMLHNLRRTMTTSELQDELAKALYISLGNFTYQGWDAEDAGALVLRITEGEGLLCGKYHMTDEDKYLHTLRARSYLRPVTDPNTLVQYQVGENLTLLEQPDYPSHLRFTITTTTEGTLGNIYISGKGMEATAPDIINFALPVNQGAGETVTYETSAIFTEVFLEGIDAHELERTGSNIYIHVKDRPLHYIYAVGTPTGVPFFRVEMDPMYNPTCNEMLIALVETDETEIIEIIPYNVGALEDTVERLIPNCDGVTRVFYSSADPKAGTDALYNDGIRMFAGMPFGKGYVRDGKKFTLEVNVPTPDANTLLVGTYRRFN